MAPPPRKAFPLRIEPALFAALERAAAADLRSVNAEIEFLLREALARRGIRIEPGERRLRGRPPATRDRAQVEGPAEDEGDAS
ncbi:toxin-antitoxin system HicB family antitoxin [Sphingomonas sp.]|uniref:toxin-antitoxin system HicB family antitoxin n=1 Tax=Sphingomonas sp. TaxID=28214 RepID=UPI000DAFF569|nr:toxin-antitoxin system HicB family antitoxin [Sphingomonas sp.]PZU06762.1 MAG: toxin-antitoxin system HicB family antitoxin [Sphingomonas sp.]